MSEHYWVGRCTWVAADELAEVIGSHVSTINRNLLSLYDDGFVDDIEVGRGQRSKRRWCLTATGVQAEYPMEEEHRYPAPDQHTHDPLDPDIVDHHQHPPWWVTRTGAERLYKKMDSLQASYSVFPQVFNDETGHCGEGPPLPVEWKRLKHGQLVAVVGTYRDAKREYRI